MPRTQPKKESCGLHLLVADLVILATGEYVELVSVFTQIYGMP